MAKNKVAEVVAMMTGVPVQRIAQAEGLRLMNMGEELRKMLSDRMKQLKKLLNQFNETGQDLKIRINQLDLLFFLVLPVLVKRNWQKFLALYSIR